MTEPGQRGLTGKGRRRCGPGTKVRAASSKENVLPVSLLPDWPSLRSKEGVTVASGL